MTPISVDPAIGGELQSPAEHRYTLNVSYPLGVLRQGDPYEKNVPARRGLDELASRIEKIRQGVIQIDGWHTNVTAGLANNELVLSIESDELTKALSTLFRYAGVPPIIYGTPKVMKDRTVISALEEALNPFGHTIDLLKSTSSQQPPTLMNRIEAWYYRKFSETQDREEYVVKELRR